jgi:hypothetical protein
MNNENSAKSNIACFALGFVAVLLWASMVSAQTTAFTFQGRITDAGLPPNGNYDFQFTLWDALVGGTQQPQPAPITITKSNLAVTGGVFTVDLDFGVSGFPGADRFLEVAVRATGGGAFKLFDQRQPFTSAPYSLRARSAATADALASGAGSTNFIQNTTTQQANSNFNISGNGTVGGNLFSNGKVGIGSTTPNHKLRISGGPFWTSNGWLGAVELDNASAIAWRSNASGNRFGIGATNGGLLFFATSSDPGAVNGPANYVLTLSDNAFVGIGTTNPAVKLDVVGDAGLSGKLRIGSTPAQSKLHISGGSTGFAAPFRGLTVDQNTNAISDRSGYTFLIRTNFFGPPNSTVTDFVVDSFGNVGVGTSSPTSKLEVAAQDGVKISGFQPFLTLNDGGKKSYVQGVNGDLVLLSNSKAELHLKDNGHVSVSVLEIQGGADLSETFAVRNTPTLSEAKAPANIQPGFLVSIDPAHPGELMISRRAYDHRVAGIISGAGGINPGMVMGQTGSIAQGKHPVALSGRVYCWADAANGPIKAGDLLTTSITPGYAMRVVNYEKARGAIIGKAMTSLKQGRGLVLVLVTLQ